MIKKYVLTNATGPTLITHEDQEQSGLRFRVINLESLGLGFKSLVIVRANDATALAQWTERVGGKEVDANEVRTHVKTLLDKAKAQRLAELDAERTEVQNWTLANVAGGTI